MLYFDHAATTPLDPRVREVLLEHIDEPLNPSSIHRSGQRARRLLEEARESLADSLGLSEPSSIVFTSGATEAANLALRSLAAASDKPLRVSSSALEHPCVRETLEQLAAAGRLDLSPLPVGEDGRAIVNECAPGGLLCLMHSNNETGVLQAVDAAREFAARQKAAWLCDASQSLGKVSLSLDELGADWVVLSAHKVYGPVGIGCLAGPGVPRLRAQITGGPQEEERRAGTQSVALARAFAAAARIARSELEETRSHLAGLEAALMEELSARAIPCRLNGSAPRLPGVLNLSFPGREALDMIVALDQHHCCLSPGSACSTGVVSVSTVLAAMFPKDTERAGGGIRVSLGRGTTLNEIALLAAALQSVLVPAHTKP